MKHYLRKNPFEGERTCSQNTESSARNHQSIYWHFLDYNKI